MTFCTEMAPPRGLVARMPTDGIDYEDDNGRGS